MSIIKEINIDRFKSCRKVKILDIDDFNCLSGKNNSGKSNILRALSLFFTNEIEPGLPFDIKRDCNSRTKEKREVTISVRIVLDEDIGIQKTLKNIQDKIPRDSSIKKVYEVDRTNMQSYSTRYFVNGNEFNNDDKHYVDTYLNLFNFRYITSDRTPKKALEENLLELQAELKFRLSKKTSELTIQNNLMEMLQNQVHILFEPVSKEIQESDEIISNVDITIPNELTELLNSAHYLITNSDGGIFNEKDQGHGIQNMLLFTILYLVDKNFHRKFGWKIATIWAIEEPESFLHFNLENQLALYLQKIISENKNRFQHFVSTHSDVFPQYASSNFYIEKVPDSQNKYWTHCEKMNLHEFIMKLNKEKITSIGSLVTMYPVNNIVLVEGYIDEYIYNIIAERENIKNIKIFSIQKYLRDDEKKGCDVLNNFITMNNNFINLRNKYGIIAIFDWDVEKSSINKLKYKINNPNMIVQLDQSNGNPLLDKTFRGIELYYSNNIIEELIQKEPGLINDRGINYQKGRYYADSGRYEKVKHELYQIIEKNNDKLQFTFFKEIIDIFKSLPA